MNVSLLHLSTTAADERELEPFSLAQITEGLFETQSYDGSFPELVKVAKPWPKETCRNIVTL